MEASHQAQTQVLSNMNAAVNDYGRAKGNKGSQQSCHLTKKVVAPLHVQHVQLYS